MALLTSSGTISTDLGTLNTIRVDISDYLMSSLAAENNFIGNLEVGPQFGSTSFSWDEDKLNPNTVTSINSWNNTDSPVTLTVSNADAALLQVGYILANQAAGGVVTGEQLQIIQIVPGASNSTLTASRGYGGTSLASGSSSATLQIVNAPTYENSDLGPDLSRARIAKTNFINRFEMNVNLSQEVIERARMGYTPGVNDELEYQFEQRLREMLRQMNQAALYSRPNSTTPSSNTGGNYQTMAGLTSWLDGTYNSTASVSDQGGAALTDVVINTLNTNINRQGAVPDWLLVGPNGVNTTGRIYNDRIRLQQDDQTRGFMVKYFDTTLQNSLRILYDQAIYDTSPNGVIYLVDSGRIRIRPALNAMFYIITAPSFRDGDAVRALSKWSLEVRNTGTDVGYAHIMAKNVQF